MSVLREASATCGLRPRPAMGGACVLFLHCGGREFKRWDFPSSVYLFIIAFFCVPAGMSYSARGRNWEWES